MQKHVDQAPRITEDGHDMHQNKTLCNLQDFYHVHKND